MYCEKCGAENSEKAKFCRKCGAETNVEIETRVAVRVVEPAILREIDTGTGESQPVEETPPPRSSHKESSQSEEATIFSISPTLLFVKAGYAAAAAGALLLVALVSVLLPAIIPTGIAILLGLMLFLIPAFYHLKQKLVSYTLTDSKLEIDSGFISRTTRNVPLGRIQDVTVSATVMQRLLGFGNLVIDNASEEGGKAILKNINTPQSYADMLLKQMRDKS